METLLRVVAEPLRSRQTDRQTDRYPASSALLLLVTALHLENSFGYFQSLKINVEPVAEICSHSVTSTSATSNSDSVSGWKNVSVCAETQTVAELKALYFLKQHFSASVSRFHLI